mgnify:CR=1 FL=1
MLIDRTADEIDIVFVVPDQGGISLEITPVFGVQISAVTIDGYRFAHTILGVQRNGGT